MPESIAGNGHYLFPVRRITIFLLSYFLRTSKKTYFPFERRSAINDERLFVSYYYRNPGFNL